MKIRASTQLFVQSIFIFLTPAKSDKFLVIRFDHGQKTGWHLYSELKEFIATQAKDGIEVFHEPLL
jgi:hypothetical protein